MRYLLLIVPLLLWGCVRKPDSPKPAVEPKNNAAIPAWFDGERWTGEVPPKVLYSPFLPALARAGWYPVTYPLVIRSVDYCGIITVDERQYHVLYIAAYRLLTSSNQRGHSYWMVCDTNLNPVWETPDLGGRPGKCSGNQVLVDLDADDGWFAIPGVNHGGDLLTFHRDGGRLQASLDWSS
ncbi:MAG: hypothetical protein KDB82_12205 [Planctomycetes bacterium]|mgnify:FL=1|nr:hypothetical protein [Planctomycetota bacterium]